MRSASLDDYLKSPVDHWVSGDGWLHFVASEPWLAGTILWGTLAPAGLDSLLRCTTAASAAMPSTHAALVDGQRTQSVDATCFRTASEYVLGRHRQLAGRVTRLAGVRPPGLIGAVAEGFYRVVPAPYIVSVFETRGEALRWLGCEAHAKTVDEIEHAASANVRESTLIGALHRSLEGQLSEPSLEVAAKALSLSVRTLQRRLHEEGTSFAREVTVIRVRVAQRLMLETADSLTRIASLAGFSTPAALSVAFRKHEGMSPSEWRDAPPSHSFADESIDLGRPSEV